MNLATIFDQFIEHGIQPTTQRLEVAAVLFSGPQHLSADQIINALREKGSKVAKATVYNCLNLFSEKGLVKECIVDRERVFYDSVTSPHHHFLNTDTGELQDIPLESVEIGALPQLPPDTAVDSVELLVRVSGR